MNYKLKYANQIVSVFVLVAVILVVFFVILVTMKQNTFSGKKTVYTEVSDASGISTQTRLVYKGFDIGKVKSFYLRPDGWVRVELRVLDKYAPFLTKDSVINRLTSPITNKTQLIFVKNNGTKEPIKENSLILSTDTPKGLSLYHSISDGQTPDMIASILANVDRLVQELGKDNNADKGSLFRFLYHLANVTAASETSIKEMNDLLLQATRFTTNLNKDDNADQGSIFRLLYNAADVSQKLNAEMSQIDNLLKTLNVAAENYSTPDSLLIKMIDPTGQTIIQPLHEVISSLGDNLNETRSMLQFLNRQRPEIATMITQINVSLDKAQKTLDALNNNPLLKSGIPKKTSPVTGTGSRIQEVPHE